MRAIDALRFDPTATGSSAVRRAERRVQATVTSTAPAAVLALLAAACFLLRHRYLLGLLGLALPVAFSLRSTRFDPSEGFLDVHSRAIGQLADRGRKLRVLEISTGTCYSLHRHGW